MPYFISIEKQQAVVAALVEGNGIRAIERQTGVHRDTIMRLGVKVGEACAKLMHEQMRGLECQDIQIDELWSFVGKKQRSVKETDNEALVGDVWIFVALDPKTKLVPCYTVGKRNGPNTQNFITDLASRMKNRIQLSSDAMNAYLTSVEESFGGAVDYGQIIKEYEKPSFGVDVEGPRKYSPPYVVNVSRKAICGEPEMHRISTSHVERQNLTMRMHVRRLTRLTTCFSRKLENHRAAVALHYGYYNFVKVHSTVRMTPAMAAGVSNRIWTVRDLLDLADHGLSGRTSNGHKAAPRLRVVASPNGAGQGDLQGPDGLGWRGGSLRAAWSHIRQEALCVGLHRSGGLKGCNGSGGATGGGPGECCPGGGG